MNSAVESSTGDIQRGTAVPPAWTPAPFGRRLIALAVDCVLSVGVAAFFTRPEPPKLTSALVMFVSYTFFIGVFHQTPGMRLLGLVCVRYDNGASVGLLRAALRTALLQLVVPAVFLNEHGRGWHDRASGAVVVLSSP